MQLGCWCRCCLGYCLGRAGEIDGRALAYMQVTARAHFARLTVGCKHMQFGVLVRVVLWDAAWLVCC